LKTHIFFVQTLNICQQRSLLFFSFSATNGQMKVGNQLAVHRATGKTRFVYLFFVTVIYIFFFSSTNRQAEGWTPNNGHGMMRQQEGSATPAKKHQRKYL